MEYLIVLLIGIAIGWLICSAGFKPGTEMNIQQAIEIEAWKRQAHGVRRLGDDLTEIEPFAEGVGYDIRKHFKLAPNSNPTPAQLKIVKRPAPPPPPPPPKRILKEGEYKKPVELKPWLKGYNRRSE